MLDDDPYMIMFIYRALTMFILHLIDDAIHPLEDVPLDDGL